MISCGLNSRNAFRCFCLFLGAGVPEKDDGQRQGNEGHCRADRQVDSEIAILHHNEGDHQQGYADDGRDAVLDADVAGLHDHAGEIRDGKAHETHGSADADRTGDQDAYHEEYEGLGKIGQFDFSLVMAGKPAGTYEGRSQAGGEEEQAYDNVGRSDSLQFEIGGAPEIILLQKVSGRGIGHDNRAQRADEGAEDDAERYQTRGIQPDGHERHDYCADALCNEGADGQGAPAGHCSRGGTEAGCASKAERIDIPQLVPPEILHLDTAHRQGDATDENIQKIENHAIPDKFQP